MRLRDALAGLDRATGEVFSVARSSASVFSNKCAAAINITGAMSPSSSILLAFSADACNDALITFASFELNVWLCCSDPLVNIPPLEMST